MICSQMSESDVYLSLFGRESNCCIFSVVTHSLIAKTNRNVSDWSMESGYIKDFIETEYPVRVHDSGREEALELVLSSNIQDHEFMCNGYLQGFLLCISTPGDSLELKRSIQTALDKDILIMVKPTLITTSKGLSTYKPMQRGCFFSFERQLRFFQSYTSQNCKVECLANFTNEKCGCSRFSMPSKYRLIKLIQRSFHKFILT